jgi:bacterioferritin
MIFLKNKITYYYERNEMSKKAVNQTIEIVSIDTKKVLAKLRTAFADEWMASYQYWMGAKLVHGPIRNAVVAELMQHYQEELNHATMIANRMVQLGGDFKMFPKEWHTIGGCHYDSLSKDSMVSVLQENIKGEQCAIGFYSELLKMVEGKDVITYNMVLNILNDEIQHNQDLNDLLLDLAEIKK